MQNEITNINDYTLILDNYKLKQDKSIETEVKKGSVGFVFMARVILLWIFKQIKRNIVNPKKQV